MKSPISIKVSSEEEKETPEQALANSRWCETCAVRHPKPHNDKGIAEKYEEWCMRVGHKPVNGLDGIDSSTYDIDKDGFVIRKSKK
jgi:hypothetical protein